jgi:hypothetical protein
MPSVVSTVESCLYLRYPFRCEKGALIVKQLITHVCLTIVIFSIISAAELFRSQKSRVILNQPAIHPSTANTSQSSPQVKADVFTPELICKYDPKEFNPRGVYYVLGRKPKKFGEFDCLELAVDHDRASGVALVQTYADQAYTSQDFIGLVTNKTVKLIGIPATEGDFEYSFEGYFLRGGVVSDAGSNQPVLKGNLIKSKRGVKIAECEVKFRVEYLGC